MSDFDLTTQELCDELDGMTRMREPSPQQQAVLDHLKSNTTHISVHALAGTGKTSLIEMCQPIRCGLNIAFNAVIRKEFQSRMPDAESHTFNSFGHKIISKAVKRINFQQDKMKGIRDSLKIKWSDCEDFFRIMDLARGHGFGFGEHAIVDASDLGSWRELIDDFMLESKVSESVFPDALKFCLKLAWEGTIDYGDQLWMPVIANLGLGFPFEIVYVDEAQDVNIIQIKLIERLGRRSQVVMVGDPHQAIYGFRGSVFDSMFQMETVLSAAAFPLSVSFRCPRSVVREAQQFVPDFEHAEHNPEGSVSTLEEWTFDTLRPGSVLLCRNNAPLVTLALQLIASGKPASVRGRDIGKSLVTLAKKVMKEYHPKTRDEYIKDTLNWRDAQISRNEAKEAMATERADTLIALLRSCGPDASAADIERKCELLFTDKDATILLSTIHKAKGLEWPHVFFLDRGLIPSRFAKTSEQREQEKNLCYVAVTRAKETLTYIESEKLT